MTVNKLAFLAKMTQEDIQEKMESHKWVNKWLFTSSK